MDVKHRVTIRIDARDMLDVAGVGPLHTDEMHETRMRAPGVGTYEDLALSNSDAEQGKLADAYAENLAVALLDTCRRIDVEANIVERYDSTITFGDDRLASVSVEQAVLAIAQNRVSVRWHVPDGHFAGGWAVFRDGMLAFEL